MRALHVLKTVPGFLAGIILGMGLVTTAAVYAVDGNPPGLFELDANVYDDDGGAKPGDDWDTLYTGGGSAIAFTEIIADPAPTSIYWKGGSKDISDVTEWWWKDGSVPDKDDITNAYAAAYVIDDSNDVPGVHEIGDLIIYFGLDRYANDGDAFAGFWFFQDDVSKSATAANRFDGQHVGRNVAEGTPGDLLVLVEYPQGSNATPEIKVYEWDPMDLDQDNVADNLDLLITVADAACDGSGNKLACATTNHVQLTNMPWSYTPKDGSVGVPPESFFEGGINITQLLGTTPCISSFLAETRSSRSETAQLKDFVLGSFDVCGIAVTKECGSADLNSSGTLLTADFYGQVTNNGGIGYIANLLDTFADANAVITAVCYDANANNICDGGEALPGNLTGVGSDDVSFDLPAGATVLYQASYSTTTIPSSLLASNDVEVYAYTDPLDVGNTSLAVADDFDDADCSFTVSPDLMVTKDCSAALSADGAGVDISVTGYFENTGNVALDITSVTDTYFDDLTGIPDTLLPGEYYTFTRNFTQTLYSHSNTLTVQAVALLGSPPASFNISVDSPTCEYIPVPELAVTKECAASFVDSSGVFVEIDGTVTNTSAVAMTNVYVNDDVLGTLAGPLDLAPGETKSYSHDFSPALSSLTTDTVDGTTTFTHTDTVIASGETVIESSEGVAYASDTTDPVTAECDTSVITAVDIAKNCETRLAVVNDMVVVVVDVSATVTNTGTEVLTGISVVDDPLVSFVGEIPSELAPGASFSLTGSYYPTTVNSSNPADASFSDTVSVEASGIFSTVDADAQNTAICDICI